MKSVSKASSETTASTTTAATAVAPARETCAPDQRRRRCAGGRAPAPARDRGPRRPRPPGRATAALARRPGGRAPGRRRRARRPVRRRRRCPDRARARRPIDRRDRGPGRSRRRGARRTPAASRAAWMNGGVRSGRTARARMTRRLPHPGGDAAHAVSPGRRVRPGSVLRQRLGLLVPALDGEVRGRLRPERVGGLDDPVVEGLRRQGQQRPRGRRRGPG